jgi:nitroreductase
MDALQAILTRRSIRLYTSEPVIAELVDELLHAAMSAPSAGNQQPWQFIVIAERHKLDAIPLFHPYANMVKLASVAILVCGDLRLERARAIGCKIVQPPRRISCWQPMPMAWERSGWVCIPGKSA